MELNHHQQDRYSPGKYQVFIEINGQIIRGATYLEVENIIRDISFVRQQSTNYLYLYSGQFRFDEMLTLPYWDFLFLKGQINKNELQNIQDGCLLIIALFFVEVFDAEGTVYIYSKQLLDKIDNALNSFQPTTDRQKIAIEKIKFLRQHITDSEKLSQNHPETRELEKTIGEYNNWIYKEFVENYFWETAKAFETDRIKSKAAMQQFIESNKKNQKD